MARIVKLRNGVCAAVVVGIFGAIGIALVPDRGGIEADDALPEQAEPSAHATPRCPHCGWIESKREILSSVANPGSLGTYEYTLRMPDGSSRVFQEALPASWRLGERLTLMERDGARPD